MHGYDLNEWLLLRGCKTFVDDCNFTKGILIQYGQIHAIYNFRLFYFPSA